MTLKHRTKAQAKAIRLYRTGKISPSLCYHLLADIIAGHSRHVNNVAKNATTV